MAGSAAGAADLKFECRGDDNGKPMTLSLVYSGGSSGQLVGSSSFGALSLKATMQSTEEVYVGKARKVVVVDASGTVPVSMPDTAAFNACLAKKKDKVDPDGTMAILACHGSVPSAASRVPTDVFIKIVIDPLVFQDAAAEVRRRFAEPSPALGRKVTLEALPPLS